MRVNVYTEELTEEVKIVATHYVSSKTGKTTTNYGLRFILKSHGDLHHGSRDDDRSAVTFWCGDDPANLKSFLDRAMEAINDGTFVTA